MATDRPAVNAAQVLIDQRLARDPLANGEELSEGLWKITVEPLTAYYAIDDGAHEVLVSNLIRSA